jgi:hypothetical protein
MLAALANTVWHALTGPHAHLAIGRGAARHYPLDIGPFEGTLSGPESAPLKSGLLGWLFRHAALWILPLAGQSYGTLGFV